MEREQVQRVGFVLLGLLALVVVLPILFVVGTIFVKGFSAISVEFLVALPR